MEGEPAKGRICSRGVWNGTLSGQKKKELNQAKRKRG